MLKPFGVELGNLISVCVGNPDIGCELLDCECIQDLWDKLHNELNRQADRIRCRIATVEHCKYLIQDKLPGELSLEPQASQAKQDLRVLCYELDQLDRDLKRIKELQSIDNIPAPTPRKEFIPIRSVASILKQYNPKKG